MADTIEQLVERTRQHVLANLEQFRPYDKGHGFGRYSWGRYYISFGGHSGAVISVWGAKEEITIPNPQGMEVLSFLERRAKERRFEASRHALVAGLSETTPQLSLWQRIKARFA